jgi:VWFA-related protein
MHTRRSFLRQSALTLGAASLNAQNGAQDGATFSSDVKVVNVLATVRTKAGEIVQDLTKEEFLLTESGSPQTIRYFSRDTNLPLVLGLLVDTSGSQRMVLEEEREASFRFLYTIIREDIDRTFVVHFDYRPEVLQNLTSSRAKLEQSLERLTLPFQYRGAGGTTLYDSIYLCSNLITKKLTGRKALVLLTDGEDTSSRTSFEDAVEAAQRADTLIYSILFSDETFGGGFRGGRGGPDGKSVLQKMSRETGGGFFEVSKKHTLDAIYQQLQEELRSQYSLGYTPPNSSGKAFRAIKVTTQRRGLIVQARSGYYADETRGGQ